MDWRGESLNPWSGVRHGHRGPTGAGVGDELKLTMGESALEVAVPRDGSLVYEPGAVGFLAPYQVLNAPLVSRIRDRDAGRLVKRNQNHPRRVGVAILAADLGPPAIPILLGS